MSETAQVIDLPVANDRHEIGPDTYELVAWAEANHIGTNTAYEYCRRSIDPLPHIKQGRRYLVEREPAIAWLRRKFGVNYEDADA